MLDTSVCRDTKDPLLHFPASENTTELSTTVSELTPVCSAHTERVAEETLS